MDKVEHKTAKAFINYLISLNIRKKLAELNINDITAQRDLENIQEKINKLNIQVVNPK